MVLDVRTPREWAGKHIAGSLNIPLNHLTERLSEILTDRHIVVHCASGYRSAIAVSLLEQRGPHPPTWWVVLPPGKPLSCTLSQVVARALKTSVVSACGSGRLAESPGLSGGEGEHVPRHDVTGIPERTHLQR